MIYKEIITRRINGTAKCLACKEPLIKNEGCIRWSSGDLYCFKCSLAWLQKSKELYGKRIRELKYSNRIGLQKLRDMKVVKQI